jgi:hypothetical protein
MDEVVTILPVVAYELGRPEVTIMCLAMWLELRVMVFNGTFKQIFQSLLY